jgi:protein involved in polysaccharide export with SLBB domain
MSSPFHASARFVRYLAVAFAITFTSGVLAALGQTSDEVQKALGYCNDPLRASTPECQAVDTTLGNGTPAQVIYPGLRTNPSTAPSSAIKEPQAQLAPSLVPGADAPSEFQRFAAASVGAILPVFGASLFERVPTTFAPVERVPVTADYVIGPGDELVLRVWGQINLNSELVVDRAGAVYIPQAGNVTVSGLQFKQLPGFLKSELGRVYRNFDLNVSMGQLRSIQVLVIGQARRPGTYTVSSLSTLVNVLFTSGGPTAQGSMRHIQLKRADTVVSEVDLYDLLLKGDKSKDIRLLPGDVVFIPTVGPQVAISGSIRNAAIYELNGERTVGDVLQLAGGLAPTADEKGAVLERINLEHQREVLELTLDALGRAVAIREADIVSIRSISPRFDRTVTLRGNVANPGRFAWREGMRLHDIIPDKESLITRKYWAKKNSLGFMPMEETVAPREPAETRLSGSVPSTKTEQPTGLRQRDRTDPVGSTLTTKSMEEPAALRQPVGTGVAGWVPDVNWTYAVIERQDPERLVTQLIPFDLGKLILEDDATQNLELRSGDVVTVFSTSDIQVSKAQQNRFVLLEGEFNASGLYMARPGETLGQLITRAGGLTSQAYLYGAEFTRESTRRDQQRRLDQFVRAMEKQLEQAASKRTSLASTAEETQALASQLQAERNTLEQLRSVEVTGRIVLNFDPSGPNSPKLMNLTLDDGDRFVVPTRPATVNVLGEVYNQNAFLFEPTRRVADYLSGAGGLTRNADKAHVFIIRADGSVLPKRATGAFTQVFEAQRLNPGDTIVVPEEILRVPFIRSLRNWTQALADLGLGAAAINVLK